MPMQTNSLVQDKPQDSVKNLLSKRLYSGIGPVLVGPSNRFFVDKSDGRTILLRGVNLSGSVKQPFTPYFPSHEPNNFFEGRCLYLMALILNLYKISTHSNRLTGREVSFVGRPFPLAEADQHFKRLSGWGFNFLRFNITWEALEHRGPGIYDEEYIQYVISILLKAKEYGFRAFIDPHQDVWSRFTGGSGAPLWTLEAVGFTPEMFTSSFSAIVQNTYPDPSHYPKMIWPTNYWKLAAATMFTLFFGGRVFAPDCLVEGINIQDWLQNHYCQAVAELAKAICKIPGLSDHVVIGYDTLNEPSMGWIGVEDITHIPPEQELRKGLTPTPFQAMKLGMGYAVSEVEEWDMTVIGPQKVADRALDPKGVKAWKNCIWANHGVWNPSTQTCLRPHYFAHHPISGVAVNALVDFWKPFVNRYTSTIRAAHSSAIMFIEPPVNAFPPVWEDEDAAGPLVFAPHWYDGLTLINKHWNPWFNVDYIGFLRGLYSNVAFAVKFGEVSIKKSFQRQLKMLRIEGEEALGGYPCVIGEIGIPFDMDGKAAYQTGDYAAQISAMDANMTALERDLLSFTLWNYTSDNCHEWGDKWNGEDLSLWSPCVETNRDSKPIRDLDNGARALEAFVRPYPIATPGTLEQMSFDLKQGVFTFSFSHSVTLDGKWDAHGTCGLLQTVTEIFLPHIHYPSCEEIDVWVSGGRYSILHDHQRIIWQCGCLIIDREDGSPTSDEMSSVSNTSDAFLTNDRKVSDTVISHKIVIQRRKKSSEVGRGGAKDATQMDHEGNEAGICPTSCAIM